MVLYTKHVKEPGVTWISFFVLALSPVTKINSLHWVSLYGQLVAMIKSLRPSPLTIQLQKKKSKVAKMIKPYLLSKNIGKGGNVGF